MKTLLLGILTLILIFIPITSEPNCPKSSYCQSCQDTQCQACFNFSDDGKAGLTNSATTCQTDMPSTYIVENCIIYFPYTPSEVYESMPQSTKIGRCKISSKKYINISYTDGLEIVSDSPIVLTNNICYPLNNCEQTVCYDAINYDFVWCNQCSYGFYPTFVLQNDSSTQYRAGGCRSGGIIKNCYWYENIGTSQVPLCTVCLEGWVANYQGTACVAKSTSTEYCNILANGSLSDCYQCWNGYLFEGATCVLKSMFSVASFIIIVFVYIEISL